MAYLAPYVHRVAISDHRIVNVGKDSVTYPYKPKKSKSLQTRSMTGEQFVEGFAQHILPTGFRKGRYFSWLASNSRTKLEELRVIFWIALGWVYWLATAHAPQSVLNPIPKVLCAACGAEMKAIATTHNPSSRLWVLIPWPISIPDEPNHDSKRTTDKSICQPMRPLKNQAVRCVGSRSAPMRQNGLSARPHRRKFQSRWRDEATTDPMAASLASKSEYIRLSARQRDQR